jgi:hypothetical protein
MHPTLSLPAKPILEEPLALVTRYMEYCHHQPINVPTAGTQAFLMD